MPRHEEPERPRVEIPAYGPSQDWRDVPPDERDEAPRGVVIIGPDGSESGTEDRPAKRDPGEVDYRV